MELQSEIEIIDKNLKVSLKNFQKCAFAVCNLNGDLIEKGETEHLANLDLSKLKAGRYEIVFHCEDQISRHAFLIPEDIEDH